MKAAMDTARRRKIARLFAVTHRPEFFSRYGFIARTAAMVPKKSSAIASLVPRNASAI
jgi:N-acetylglutamate synthase-like GNAT family acetyltransferase